MSKQQIDIEQIIGTKKIVEIKLSKYTISLNFEGKLKIVICDSLQLKKEGMNIAMWRYNQISDNLGEVINIIEEPISGSSFSETSGLYINFENFELIISKPDNDYEYLHILSKDHGMYFF